MNIENINSNKKIYSKEKNPIDYIFSKNYKTNLRKEVRWKYSKIQSKLIMWVRKKESQIQIQKKRYIQNKNKIQQIIFFLKVRKKTI